MIESYDEMLRDLPILVVDDVEDNRELLLAFLADLGYTDLKTAAGGKEAVEMLEQGDLVDLVLLDINMPDMDGFQVLKLIKSSDTWRSIPVIMVTAIDQIENTIRCIENGAEDCITKPIEETLLKARVHACLERKYLRDKEENLLRDIQLEKQRSEAVLFNVLPQSVAERLKSGEEEIAEHMDEVTVCFADLVGFTEMSSRISASELVQLLNDVFSTFDFLATAFDLEKIKTIGDAYMAVGGIPPHTEGHARRSLQFALSALGEIEKFNRMNDTDLAVRIGLNTGPVVAGVIGQTRFTYDLWGDTVNLASRMEATGLPGHVQVAGDTYLLLAAEFPFDSRGQVEVKGKGFMQTFITSNEIITRARSV